MSSLNNAGPHGLTEVLYAFSSGAGNNGSALAGLNANTPWYNAPLGLTMLIGRFWMIIPALAIAGILAGKRRYRPVMGRSRRRALSSPRSSLASSSSWAR